MIKKYLASYPRHDHKFSFVKMWEECKAAGDQMPVEGYNAYLAALDFEELPKLKVQ
jgi:hypothetical protein